MKPGRMFSLSVLLLLSVLSPCMGHEGNGIPFRGKEIIQADISDLKLDPNSFSVAAWVRLDQTRRSQIFLSTNRVNSGFSLYLYRDQVRFLVGRNEKDAYDYVLAPAPAPDTWSHYCGTCDGQFLRIYMNGKLVSQKKFHSRLNTLGTPVEMGCCSCNMDRVLRGAMDDMAIWKRVLSDDEVMQVFKGSPTDARHELAACWNAKSAPKNAVSDGKAWKVSTLYFNELLNTKDDGFRSIWYYNQEIDNEYVYKYSGGLGTYPANHYPFSVYCPKVNKTFFCYGGTNAGKENTLWHEVACFDHATGKVSVPTIIINKRTSDAHDNPVMTVDDNGHIWIFSTSHGTSRPSYIHRSVRPYDCTQFELVEPVKRVGDKEVPMTNFSYVQMFNVPGKGMAAFFTTYDKSLLNDPESIAARIVCFMTSKDGVHWSAWKPLAAIVNGHYQNAAIWQDKKLGTSFNYHPWDKKEGRLGLNWRTNLYYIETLDMGKTWQTIDGRRIEIPMKDVASPALVYDYEALRLNVYIMDMVYDQRGWPIIFYITSKGFESGPENDPRIVYTAHWNGKQWDIRPMCHVDNNYDFGSIYVEKDGTWTVIGALDDGPQKYNTGGEMALWQSKDEGATWTKKRQMTQNSPRNHCYPRRPINAHPDFYAFWADGNGREKSEATLYFSNSKGDVFQLPRTMKESVKPNLYRSKTK
ncbi:MAG: BNR-4 repeat-containing protein [Thermoguttaceae bacterium]|nr:BNR-4 repeat-containing protein [Thermoguttaceae bacterium]